MILALLLAQLLVVPPTPGSPIQAQVAPPEWLQPGSGVRAPFCNVLAAPYFAPTNGVIDSAPAINAAIAACEHVYIPAGTYNVGSTLLIDDRTGLTMEGAGVRGVNNGLGATGGLGTIFYWTGNSTDPAIKVYGSAHVRLQSFKILAQATAQGGTALDTGIRFETKLTKVNTANKVRDVTITSSGQTLHNAVTFVAGTGGDANNDQGTFENLVIGGYDTAGVDIQHAQSVDHRFYNLLFGSGLGGDGIKALTGATFSVYGGGGGGHLNDFNVRGSGFTPISIYDVHTENSGHFLNAAPAGVPTNSGGPVTVVGCSFTDGSVAANGRVIDFETPGPLTLINFVSNFDTTKNKTIHYDATGLVGYGFNVMGLNFVTSAANAFDSFQPTFMTGLLVTNAGGVTGQKSKYTSPEILLPYSASIATDAGLSSSFRIEPTNGTAFTIAFPTNGVKGQRLLYCIRNISGGAMGVVTWTSFKMAAFTNPANGSNRCIEFKFDGFNYYEINRTTADVPN